MTEKRLKANRENAKCSTGPRTPEGKRAACFNAVKDGILAKDVIGSGRIVGESLEGNVAFVSELVEDCEPVGKFERALAVDIAGYFICKQRADRAEQAAIEIAQRESDSMETIESLQRSALAAKFPKSLSARGDVLRSLVAVQYLINRCAEALQQLESGQINKHTLGELDRFLGTDFVDRIATPSELPGLFAELKSALEQSAAGLQKKRALLKLSKSLPEALDRIIRYKSMVHRHLMQTMQQLATLQQCRRQRKEEQND